MSTEPHGNYLPSDEKLTKMGFSLDESHPNVAHWYRDVRYRDIPEVGWITLDHALGTVDVYTGNRWGETSGFEFRFATEADFDRLLYQIGWTQEAPAFSDAELLDAMLRHFSIDGFPAKSLSWNYVEGTELDQVEQNKPIADALVARFKSLQQ